MITINSIELPNPVLGDGVIVRHGTTIHRTMQGMFHTYIKPLRKQLNYSFSNVPRDVALQLLPLMDGSVCTHTDMNDDSYNVKIATDPTSLVTNLESCGPRVSFQLLLEVV